MTLLESFQWLQDMQLATELRESVYMFPLLEGTHLLGLALSAGLIIFTDMRLVGVWFRHVPVPDILHQLRPWVLGGFVATLVSGIVLFWAEAASMITNPAFLLKLVFILLAGINALIFEAKFGKRVTEWSNQLAFPTGVKFAGWTSLTLWVGVIAFGRLIPYFPK
jgi:hypothetical protein